MVNIKESVVIINNKFENRIFVYDRLNKVEFDINEEAFQTLNEIYLNSYDLDEINSKMDIDFIKELFSYGILTCDEQKKYYNVKQLVKYNNARIYAEITNKCNLRCRHCYGNFNCSNNKFLEINQLKDIIIKSSEKGTYQFDITGGEPLLYPDLEKLLKILYENGMIVRVFTNLTLFNEKILKMFKKYGVKSIVTSIDSSISKVHDNFRGQKQSFEKTVKAIEILKKNNFDVTINTMIGEHNKKEHKKLNEFISSLAVNNVLDVIVPEGRGVNITENIYESAKRISEIYRENIKIVNKDSISVNCGIGERFIYLKSDGYIYICPSLIFEKYCLGTIDDFDLYKIWSKMNKDFGNLICSKWNVKCGDCRGGCRARALLLNDSIFEKDDVYCIIKDVF